MTPTDLPTNFPAWRPEPEPVRYGFIVLPEEIRPRGYFDEGMDGTLFVEVERHFMYPDKVSAHFYYQRNSAKFNIVTEDQLRWRFPKSFAKNDAGIEWDKLFNHKENE